MCAWKLTPYVIRRDHANRSGFFVVNVSEAGHRGFGFQLRVGAHVVGLSLIRIGKPG